MMLVLAVVGFLVLAGGIGWLVLAARKLDCNQLGLQEIVADLLKEHAGREAFFSNARQSLQRLVDGQRVLEEAMAAVKVDLQAVLSEKDAPPSAADAAQVALSRIQTARNRLMELEQESYDEMMKERGSA